MSQWPYLWMMAKQWYPHLAFAATILLKAALVIVLAWAASRFLLQRSAKWRRRLWLTSFLLVLALPLIEWAASFSPGPWVSIPFDSGRINQASKYASDHGLTINSQKAYENYQHDIETDNQTHPKPVWRQHEYHLVRPVDLRVGLGKTVDEWGVIIWAGICAVGLAWLLLRHLANRWWLKRNLRMPSDHLSRACHTACEFLRIKRGPIVSTVDAPISPMVRGFWPSHLLFPKSAEEWSPQTLRQVLMHELAHVERHDPLWQGVMRLGCWLVWWNPFLHLAAAQFRRHSEAAADEYVLVLSIDAQSYAETLVDLARRLRSRRGWIDGVFVIRQGSLETRIRALLAFDSSRAKLSWMGAGALVVVLSAAFVVLVEKVGYAFPPTTTTAQVQEHSRLDPSLEQALRHYVVTEKARQARIRRLHFVLERNSAWQLKDGRILSAPAPTHLEGWIDVWSGVHRFEYRPQVTRWIAGSSPFYTGDVTQINDGSREYYITPQTDLENLSGRPATRYGSFQEDGTESQQTALEAVQAVLVHFQFPHSTFDSSFRISVKWAAWKGMKVIEIVQEFYAPPVKIPSQRQVFRFDPDHDDALVYYDIAFPSNPNGTADIYEVEKFAKSSAGFFYPSVYRTTFDRLAAKDGDRQESTTTIKQYDVLDSLPQGITDPPKPKGIEYVTTSSAVVQPASLRLAVVDLKTGQTVPNSPVEVSVNRQPQANLKTDAVGVADIPLPKEEVTDLHIRCDNPAYVPQSVTWRKTGNPLRLPSAYQLHLSAAAPIAGRIVDESGRPIPAAEITAFMWLPRDSIEAFSDRFGLGNVTTQSDADGKWRIERFPPSLDGLTIRVSHPGYQATTDGGVADYIQTSGLPLSSLRDGSSVIVLKRGNEIMGQIFGSDGQPLAKVRLVIGKDIWGTNLPEATTDAAGHFDFKGIAPGDNHLTVQAAEHKPQILPIKIPLAQPLAIHLQKGRVLKGCVVDANGKPCAGLNIDTDTWNTLRTLNFHTQTDATGHFIWDGAPDEPVTFAFGGCQNREFLSDLPLQAGETEQKIVIKPALHLTAKVLDKKTGRPIARFHVVPGLRFANSPDVLWEGDAGKAGENGVVDWKTDRMGPSCIFKIEAEGYEPLISDPYRTDQSDYQVTFHLVAKSN